MNPISYQSIFPTLDTWGLLKRSHLSRPGQGSLQINSQSITRGDVFIAMQGTSTNSHAFIPQAIESGAHFLIFDQTDTLTFPLPEQVSWAEVTNSRAAWAALSAQAYGNPQNKLSLYGVTGTNGKTSTTQMAGQLIRLCGSKCLTIGTLGASDGTKHWPSPHTTPDPPELFALLNHCVENHIPTVIMEVSSHAMEQQKVFPLKFSGGAFTSFSQDHLDFHKTMGAYWEAKLAFFTTKLEENALVLVNETIKNFPMHQFKNGMTYGGLAGSHHPPSLKILLNESSSENQIITIQYTEKEFKGEFPFSGFHNAENFTAAWAIARDAIGKDPDPSLWKQVKPIPGRCEVVNPNRKNEPTVIIDFAHTPDALKTVLLSLKKTTEQRLWLVFGCGGDRDKGKRPKMAKIGEDYANFLVLTSDNPRSENPETIIEDMKAGLCKNRNTFVEINREDAISFAIRKAIQDDIVLIAGKGHENYQIFKDKKIPFSDHEIAMHCLETFWRNHDDSLDILQTMA